MVSLLPGADSTLSTRGCVDETPRGRRVVLGHDGTRRSGLKLTGTIITDKSGSTCSVTNRCPLARGDSTRSTTAWRRWPPTSLSGPRAGSFRPCGHRRRRSRPPRAPRGGRTRPISDTAVRHRAPARGRARGGAPPSRRARLRDGARPDAGGRPAPAPQPGTGAAARGRRDAAIVALAFCAAPLRDREPRLGRHHADIAALGLEGVCVALRTPGLGRRSSSAAASRPSPSRTAPGNWPNGTDRSGGRSSRSPAVGTRTYYVPVGEDAPAGTHGYVEQEDRDELAAVQQAGFPIQSNPVEWSPLAAASADGVGAPGRTCPIL